MGLFDFVSNVGTKLFTAEDEAGAIIKKHIDKLNPGVGNLTIDVKDGVAYLAGEAKDIASKEKAILMAGNLKGIAQVVADDVVVVSQEITPGVDNGSASVTDTADISAARAEIKTEYYVIEPGDSLSKIAKKYYGNAKDYPRIFEANREVIQDPDKIFPGQKIRIPLD